MKRHTYPCVMHQLIHSTGAQGCAYCVDHGVARVDVADQLRLALAGISPLLEENDLGLLHAWDEQLVENGSQQGTLGEVPLRNVEANHGPLHLPCQTFCLR